jgi:uncharacterized HAD superfamily protein
LSKKLLGLDIDGVIYNWQEAAFIHLRDFHNYGGTYEELFTTNDFWGKQTTLFKENFVRIETLYYKFPPTKKFIECMNRLASKFDIIYITHRTTDLAFVTEKYLSNFKFPNPCNVVYTKDKATAICEYGVDIFVDDRAEILSPLCGLCDTFLMSQPWNYSAQSKFNVVQNMYDLEEKLNAVC